MRSGAITFLFLLFSYVVQTTWMAHIFFLLSQILGVSDLAFQRFDFALLAVMYLSLHRSRSSALIWAVLAGMLADSFGLAWKGASAFGLISVALLGSFLKDRVLLAGLGSIVVLVALMTMFEAVVHLGLGRMFHGNDFWSWGQTLQVLRNVVIQSVVAPLVFWTLKSLDHWAGLMHERRTFPLMTL